MLLKIKTIPTALLLVLTFSLTVLSQTITPVNAPSTADIMRERIAKAKAYIVVKNYNAAIYELENIRRESADPALDSVINVLLMNSFLEQGDYPRAQNFLTGLAKDQKAGKPNSAANYFAVAAQVIRCSRTQLERYHSMGLNVSDRTLPEAASADVAKMRATLELVVDQSRELGKDKRYVDSAVALLEGATTARSNLAKDDYDANHWKIEAGDAREQLASSRTTIINAVDFSPAGENRPAVSNVAESNSNQSNSVLLPVGKEEPAVQKRPVDPPTTKQPPVETVARAEKPAADSPVPEVSKEVKKEDTEPANTSSASNRNRMVVRSAPKTESQPAEKKTAEAGPKESKEDTPKNDSPLEVGSLAGYAIKTVTPVYPSVARSMRMSGVVKVEVLLDENGKVTSVQNTDGPTLLQDAAQNAVKKWKFTPFLRDGEPVKAIGYVSFNFKM